MILTSNFDPDNASTYDTYTMETKIKTFLSDAHFPDDNTGNTKLYNLNKKICDYLNGTENDEDFVNALVSDINGGTVTQTASYQTGATPNSLVTRNRSDDTWSIGHTSIGLGTLVIPHKNTIKANIMAALAKSGSNLTEGQVNAFLAQYNTSNKNDLAELAYINDLVNNYADGRADISILTNAIAGPSKLNTKPTYIDDVAHYNISMETIDHSNDVKINYEKKDVPVMDTREVIDYDNQTTKQLIEAYYAQLNGFIIIGDANDPGMDESVDWLINMITTGTASIVKPKANGSEGYEDTSIAVDTSLQEIANEKNLKKAEAQYEADMKRIDRKDARYDAQLAVCDNERNAVKAEMETLKNVAKDNVDRTFKLFS